MGYIQVRCSDCKRTFMIDEDAPIEKIPVLAGHVWASAVEQEKTGCEVRHRTQEDDEDAKLDDYPEP